MFQLQSLVIVSWGIIDYKIPWLHVFMTNEERYWIFQSNSGMDECINLQFEKKMTLLVEMCDLW